MATLEQFKTLNEAELATVEGGDRGSCAELAKSGFPYKNCPAPYRGRPKGGDSSEGVALIGSFLKGFWDGFN